jgi:hypothetical protein
MRNFLLGLLVGLMLAQSHLYPMSGIVTEVNREADTVTVTTQNGHMWEFYGAEDWMEGDVCALMMNDMGTAEVTDDMIVSARYCGTAQALSLR